MGRKTWIAAAGAIAAAAALLSTPASARTSVYVQIGNSAPNWGYHYSQPYQWGYQTQYHYPQQQYHGYPQGRRFVDRDRDGINDRYDRDLDNDGRPNHRDFDRDGDGVPNRYDRRPDNRYRY